MTIDELKDKLDALEAFDITESNNQHDKQDDMFDFFDDETLEEVKNITTEYLNKVNLSYKHVKIDETFYHTYDKEDIIRYLSELSDFDSLVREIYLKKISIKKLNLDDCFHYKKLDLTTIEKTAYINDKLKDIIKNTKTLVTIIEGVNHPYDILMGYIAKIGSNEYYDSLYGREILINCYMDDEEAVPILIRIENEKIKEKAKEIKDKRRASFLVESIYMAVSLLLSILFIYYVKNRYDRGDLKDNFMLYFPFLSLFIMGFIKQLYNKIFKDHYNHIIASLMNMLGSFLLFIHIILLTTIAYPGDFPFNGISVVFLLWLLFSVYHMIQPRFKTINKIMWKCPFFKDAKFFLGPLLFYITVFKDDKIITSLKLIFHPLLEILIRSWRLITLLIEEIWLSIVWFFKNILNVLKDIYLITESWFVDRFGFMGYIILILLILVLSSAFVTWLIINSKKTREIMNDYKLKR